MKKRCAFCSAVYAEEELFCPECAALDYELIDDGQAAQPVPPSPEEEARSAGPQPQPQEETSQEPREAIRKWEPEDKPEPAEEPEAAPVQTTPAPAKKPTHADMDERRQKLRRLQMMVWHKNDGSKQDKGAGKGELRFEKMGVVFHWQYSRALGFAVRWVPRKKEEVHFLYSDIRRAEMVKLSGVTPILVLRMKKGRAHSFFGTATIAEIQETADVINGYIGLNG